VFFQKWQAIFCGLFVGKLWITFGDNLASKAGRALVTNDKKFHPLKNIFSGWEKAIKR
jgi:hypothetical protein